MRIIAAIDASDESDKHLAKAIELARLQGAALTILSVAEDFHDSEAMELGGARGEERLLARAENRVRQAKATAAEQGVAAEVIVERNASPAESILRVTEEKRADLLVVGRRSKKGLRFLVGGNVSKIVEHAPCSVLVVK